MIIDGKEPEKTRKVAIEKFKKEHPYFDVIYVKKLGGLMLVAVSKVDSEEFATNPPPEGKFPMIITERGTNSGTERILPIQWMSQEGELHEIRGSFIYIKDSGKMIGKPGIIFPPEKKKIIEK